MTVALYVRVSTDEQAQTGYSIEEQKERLIAFARSQGFEEYRLYIDDGYTGTNIDRPALQRLLKHVHAGTIDMVIVTKIDRLSRRQKDVLHIIEDELEPRNVAFRSASEPMDTSTPFGKAILGMLSVFAQLDRDMVVERLSTGLRQRVKSGKWAGGRVPFGYNYNSETGKLEIVEHQAELVREMYRRYLRGQSLNDLAFWMQDRTNERIFTHTTVREMLERSVYMGISTHGEVFSEEIADPIIDAETWQMVQTEREKRKDGKTPSGNYLLSGLMRCGLCGGPIIHIIRRSNKGTKRQYPLYACKHQHHRPKNTVKPICRVGYRNQIELDAWVVQKVKGAALDPSVIRKQAETRSADTSRGKQAMSELTERLNDVNARLDRWYDAFEEGKLDATRLNQRTKALEDDKRKLEERIRELELDIVPSHSKPAIYETLKLVKAWDYMTLQEQQEVLRSMIETIIITPKGEEPVIHWNVK